MGISDQDSHLALTAPALYVIRAYLHIHRILTGGIVMGVLAQGTGEEETPYLLSSVSGTEFWSGVHQS